MPAKKSAPSGDQADGASPKRTRKPRAEAQSSGKIYQFRIELVHSHPPIWRRIQVEDCTFDKLHEHIQTAMGWTNSHLHQFKINKRYYGDPELMQENFDEFDFVGSTTTKLSEVLSPRARSFKFSYEYDFGDSWDHEIVLEGTRPRESDVKYPRCVEGERACPMEDCGGIFSYQDYVAALADPSYADGQHMLEWWGNKFKPEKFDAAQATKEMRKGIFDWRKAR